MEAVRALARELGTCPAARGLTLAAAAAGALRSARVPARQALVVGAMLGAVERSTTAGHNRITRASRNAAEQAGLAMLLGHPLPFGGGAIDADFGRVIVETALGLRPGARVVELGAGVSTALLAHHAASHDATVTVLEHDPSWAAACLRRLERMRLGASVTLLTAPLAPQRFSDCEVAWYAADVVGAIPGPIDLLVVDGPPSRGGRERHPALEVLHDRLADNATVLVDDGRRLSETRMVRRWARRHGLELRYIDTIKGAWRLTRGAPGGRPPRVRLARAINPYPAAYGLEAVRA